MISSEIRVKITLDADKFGIDGLSDMDHVMAVILEAIKRLCKRFGVEIDTMTYTRGDDNHVAYYQKK